MTKAEVIGLYTSLTRLGHLQGVKFAYGVAKNLNILKPEVEAIQSVKEPPKEWVEYDAKRVEICEKFAVKNEDGTAKRVTAGVVGGEPLFNYVIENLVDFDKEVAKLRKEYKEVIEARDKQIADYEKLLTEPSTVELYKIKLSDLPEGIKTEEVNKIFNLIEE